MSKLKMNCGYCGRKCDLDKDFCIPQDSVYVCKSCYDWQNRVADLEAKLAEKEFAHNSYFEKAEATISFLQQQFNEKGKIEEQLEELKYQLIEKDEEIKNLVLAHFESDTNKPVLTTTQIIDQNKISFAVEQLEKVKETINTYNKEHCFLSLEIDTCNKSVEFIDNQIEELEKGIK